ncbi:MAG: hypothetical protein V3R84_04160 [Acidimicrobiia bacterium]
MDQRSDRIAAIATGIGTGLIVLMVAWLIVNRIAAIFWEAPVGPVVAIAVAMLGAIGTAIVVGSRLVRSLAN